MADLKLGAVESRFADLIWENEPLSSAALVKLSEENLSWKKSTTYTVVKKLSEKGLLKNENAVITALVPREAVQAEESAAFVERTFGGSLPAFLAAFMGGRKLDKEEAQAIRQLIDEYEEGEK